jgi:peroxiredoxin
MQMIQKGDKAPNFTLVDTDRKERSLTDFNGKNVVILFFPMAFTSVCTDELCAVRDELSFYNDLNSEVLAISVDSPFTLSKYKQDQNYNFTLLSDWNKEAARAYDALYEEFVLGLRGVAKRSAFVIDKKGYVQYAEVLENAGQVPDFVKIKETLSSIS